MEKKQIDHDLYVSIGLLIFEAMCYWMTFSFKVSEISATFPRAVLLVMMALTAALAVQCIRKTLKGMGEKKFYLEEAKTSMVTYLILVAYTFIFYKVNYFVAAPLLLLSLFIYLKFREWKKIVPIIVLYMLGVYVIFVRILGQYRLIRF